MPPAAAATFRCVSGIVKCFHFKKRRHIYRRLASASCLYLYLYLNMHCIGIGICICVLCFQLFLFLSASHGHSPSDTCRILNNIGTVQAKESECDELSPAAAATAGVASARSFSWPTISGSWPFTTLGSGSIYKHFIAQIQQAFPLSWRHTLDLLAVLKIANAGLLIYWPL